MQSAGLVSSVLKAGEAAACPAWGLVLSTMENSERDGEKGCSGWGWQDNSVAHKQLVQVGLGCLGERGCTAPGQPGWPFPTAGMQSRAALSGDQHLHP